jgi:hypothetical protein
MPKFRAYIRGQKDGDRSTAKLTIPVKVIQEIDPKITKDLFNGKKSSNEVVERVESVLKEITEAVGKQVNGDPSEWERHDKGAGDIVIREVPHDLKSAITSIAITIARNGEDIDHDALRAAVQIVCKRYTPEDGLECEAEN